MNFIGQLPETALQNGCDALFVVRLELECGGAEFDVRLEAWQDTFSEVQDIGET